MMLILIRKRKRNWLDHWLRKNCLLKDTLEGMVNGRRVRGGIITQWNRTGTGDFEDWKLHWPTDSSRLPRDTKGNVCEMVDNDGSFRQCAVFKFLVKEEKSAAEIHLRLQRAYGDVCMGASSVRRWVKHFEDGNTSIQDEPRSGRPRTASTERNKERVALPPHHYHYHYLHYWVIQKVVLKLKELQRNLCQAVHFFVNLLQKSGSDGTSHFMVAIIPQ
ncbi:hypothetical protein ANN_14453 [Periplaneta americana]|uniref:Mos1 transposase HTH domain-containing protein n=1 Tax=Periplaneta americana TaxID=6978 RepID=A0ABQ8SWC5_PERAM|nr:hypothetical protein ANN_14453 [Periplaneta americana]